MASRRRRNWSLGRPQARQKRRIEAAETLPEGRVTRFELQRRAAGKLAGSNEQNRSRTKPIRHLLEVSRRPATQEHRAILLIESQRYAESSPIWRKSVAQSATAANPG